MCTEFVPLKLWLGVPNCTAFEHLKLSTNIGGSKEALSRKSKPHVSDSFIYSAYQNVVCL